MLVEQEQDLRKLGESWRMFIHQFKDSWWVMLSRQGYDDLVQVQVHGNGNSVKRAWKEAFKKAKEYEDNLKKSS